MSKPKKMAVCHPNKTHKAKGFCANCYANQLYHKYSERQIAKSSEYHRQHKEQHSLASRNWQKRNPERARQNSAKWSRSHPGQVSAMAAIKKARKLQATPKWLPRDQIEEIKQIYINRPDGFHVDHIYPLKGVGSCGLHVPWNLQYLTAKENITKGNTMHDDNPI